MNSLKKGALTLAAGAVLGLSSFAATALETTFVGYTNGCFGLACPVPSTSALQTETKGGVTYRNSNFDVTTVLGGASIGDTVAIPNFNNLGSFILLGTPFVYSGETFKLRVTFTAPPGTTPDNRIIVADLSGAVLSSSIGRLTIDFDNTAQHFTFGDGTFDLFVNDVDLTPGGLGVPLTGRIIAHVTAVPEPETYALFMAGLAAVGFMARRRRKS